MKLLKDLLYGVRLEKVMGRTDSAITGVVFDSRKVEPGDAFVAIKGATVDGHEFIEAAIRKGATAVVIEDGLPKELEGIAIIQVVDSHKALAQMAANYYDHPSRDLNLVGVTGTNGKTTITSLLYQLFQNSGYKAGLISTVEIKIAHQSFDTSHTTPDPMTINRVLDQMRTAGVDYCFMEVSSHGIAQHRTTALHFRAGIFSNLSHDHLDYHNTFAEYRDVKKLFFDGLDKKAFALTNLDDKNGAYMLQNTRAQKIGYALKTPTDYHGKILENQFGGLLMKVNEHELWSTMVGAFNAYNVLAIYGCAVQLGLEPLEVLTGISRLKGVSGRFQYFTTAKDRITAIVDYAHTPDALKNVLETINSIRTRNEQLITVVGCGGDRDTTKRAKMAYIAAALSDKAIFTSDNPRTEDPEAIIRDMEQGVDPVDYKKTLSITDRRQAIKTATQLAQARDIILIAGKGHETYQERNGVRTDFDDRVVVSDFLNQSGR